MRVKLTGKAKRLVKKTGSVPVTLRLTPDGGAPVTVGLVLTRQEPARASGARP